MSEHLLSPHQVADTLGVHVRTVRNYVRDGRLPATRVGKQYRISREDLAAFAGPAAVREVRRQPHVDVSVIVAIDAIERQTADRISNGLMATANARPPGGRPLRVECLYDEQRGRMKVIVDGDVDAAGYLLKLVDLYLESDG